MLRVAEVLELVVQRLLRAARLLDWVSSEVAANDACCIWVLKQSSPTTPPSSTRLTRVTNGIGRRGTRRGYDGEPGPGDGVLGEPRDPVAELEGGVLMLLLS